MDAPSPDESEWLSLASFLRQNRNTPISLPRRLQWVCKVVRLFISQHRCGALCGNFTLEDLYLDDAYEIHALQPSPDHVLPIDEAEDLCYLATIMYQLISSSEIDIVGLRRTLNCHLTLSILPWAHTINRCAWKMIPTAAQVLEELRDERPPMLLPELSRPLVEIANHLIGQRGYVEILGSNAIKLPLPRAEKSYRTSIAREAYIHERLPPHHHIVTFLDYDPFNYRLKMENLVGGTMEAYLEKGSNQQALSRTTRINWALNILDALEHLHHHNIIHGDLHTGNIMLDGQQNIKIIDLSEAVLLGPQLSDEWFSKRFHRFETNGVETTQADLANAGRALADILWEGARYCELDFGMVEDAYTDDSLDEVPALLCDEVLARAAKEGFRTAEEFRSGLVEWGLSRGIVYQQGTGEIYSYPQQGSDETDSDYRQESGETYSYPFRTR